MTHPTALRRVPDTGTGEEDGRGGWLPRWRCPTSPVSFIGSCWTTATRGVVQETAHLVRQVRALATDTDEGVRGEALRLPAGRASAEE